MKSIQNLIALLLSVACLVLAVFTVVTGRKNTVKQMALQQQAAAIQNEARSLQGTEQVSRDILTDLGNSALTNEAIRAFLEKHGYTLTPNQPPAGTPALPVVTTTPVAAEAAPATLAPAVAAPAPKAEVVTPPVSAPIEPPAKVETKEDKP